jgi:WD40 repeat protein
MPDDRPRATLSDRQARGGVIGGKGYGFQAAYIVSRIPRWLADPDFTMFLQEGAGDVDVRFGREGGEERRYVQVKNYAVKPATAREVFTQFLDTDKGSPGTYTRFTLACPGLHDKLKPLRAAVEELRAAAPFFRPGQDLILDNTWADLEKLVKKLGLPLDAAFLVDKVHFDTDLAGLKDATSLRRLFTGSLVELERWTIVPPEAAARAYEKLALKCHQALRETYTRQQVEAMIQEAVEEVAPARVVSDVCPYRGLAAFTETEAEFFFGRQEVVDRLVGRLKREPRFLAVLGPSGSGKSSLVQAGLIPRLRTGAVSGSDRWGVIVIRPADHPFHGLEAQGLTGAGEGLVEAVRAWLDDHPERTRLVLVADQFEELLVITPRDLRRDFVEQLTELLEADLPITVVLVIRNDFYSRLDQEAPALLSWLSRGLENVPATLSRDELRDIAEEPARAVGLVFEPGLVEVILDDALEPVPGTEVRTGRSTTLPLLEFALAQLWERRRDGVLTHEAYEAIGGVTGGLTQWADLAFHSLEKERQQLARRVFTDLVHLGDESQGLPDSRRRRPLEELSRSEGERETVHLAVRRLADARLLTTGRDLESGRETVELIHDALLREWGLLQRWLAEDRRFLAWRQEVERQIRAWVESAPDTPKRRDNGRLLRGPDLVKAEHWLAKRRDELRAAERAFVAASSARAKMIRYLRAGIVASAFLVLTSFVLLYREQLDEAIRQREAAVEARQIAFSRQLATQSDHQLNDNNWEAAMLLAIEAGRAADTAEGFAALRQAFAHPVRTLAIFSDDSVTWNANGSRVLTKSEDGAVRVWEAKTGNLLASFPDYLGWSGRAVWNADGDRILTVSWNDLVQVWNADTGDNPVILSGCTGRINQAAWSADGSRILTAGWDGTARIWDAQTGKELLVLTGHPWGVNQASWNAEENRILTASDDGTARVWDAETGQELLVLAAHEGGVNQAVWNASESRILTAGCDREDALVVCEESVARVWDMETGKELLTLAGHTGWVNQAVWNASESRILTASDDNTARVWNAETGEGLLALIGHTGTINQAMWSADESRILTASDDNTARVWNADTGEELLALIGHTGTINQATWSADESRILTASDDNTVRVWSAKTGEELLMLVDHTKGVNQAMWSADESRILTTSDDNTVRVWSAETGEELVAVVGCMGEVIQAVWSTDESRILTTGRTGVMQIWDARTGEEKRTLSAGCTSGIDQAVWSADGSRILIPGSGNKVRMWDTETGAELLTIAGHTEWVNQAMWSADESRILTASKDGTARVWDTQTGEELVTLAGHTGWVNRATWSRDEKRILTASSDDSIRVWNAETGRELIVVSSDTGDVRWTAWNADGTRILTVECDSVHDCSESIVRVWDAKTGEGLTALSGHTGDVKQAAWNADENRVLTASEDGTARVWDAETGEELLAVAGHTYSVWKAVWNSDESYILTVGCDQKIVVPDGYLGWFSRTECLESTARVWSAETGEERATLSGYTDRIAQVTWDGDSSRILTAEWDPVGFGSTVRVWDVEAEAELPTISDHSVMFNQASWNADGRFILTIGTDRDTPLGLDQEGDTVQVWDAEAGTELFALSGHMAVWSADGSRLLAASSDGTAGVWNVETGEELLAVSDTGDWVTRAVWSTDESRILTAAAGLGGVVRVWDAETGMELTTLTGSAWLLGSRPAWSADGGRILTVKCYSIDALAGKCAEGTVQVWDAETGIELLSVYGHTALWSPGGGRILTIGCEMTAYSSSGGTVCERDRVQVLDVETGEEMFAVSIVSSNGASGYWANVEQAMWNNDGSRFLAVSSHGTVQVWEVETGSELVSLSSDTGRIAQAAWNADGSRILTVECDSTSECFVATVRVWNSDTGKELATFSGHTSAINQAAWNADGNRILTASADGTARVWDAETGEELVTLSGHKGAVEQAVWSGDESRILTVGADGTVHQWYTQMEDLLETACLRTPRNMTREEWRRFMGNEEYRATCPDLPIPPEE